MLVATALAAGVLLCAQAPQTDLPRAKAFGIVRDLDGAPWGGVTVRLFGRPVGSLPAVGALDEVRARTDDAGRFRALVLQGRTYSAWAVGEDGRCTTVAEGVRAGDPVELREFARRARATRVQVEDFDAWAARGPLRWRVLTTTTNVLVHEGQLGDEGVIELPPLPGAIVHLLLLDRDGRFLLEHELLESGDVTLALAPSRTVHARFRIAGTTEGVDGGTLWWVGRAGAIARIPVAELDDQGCAELQLPVEADADVSGWAFRVTSAGYNTGIPVGFDDLSAPDAEVQQWREDGALFLGCGLFEGWSAKGRLGWRDGSPAAGVTIRVRNDAASEADENTTWGAQDHWTIRTDADGAFVATDVNAESAVALEVVLTDDVMARLPEGWRGRVGSVGLLGVIPAKAGAAHDLGDIVLDRDLWPLELELVTPDGMPAGGAFVALTPFGTSRRVVRADRLGRVCLLVPRPLDLAVGAIHASGAYAAALDLTADGVPAAPQCVRLGLAPTRELSIRVIDGAGAPVEGARLTLGPEWGAGVRLSAEPVAPTTPDTVAVQLGTLDDAELSNMAWQLLNTQDVETDREGIARVRIPAFDMRLHVQVNAGQGAAWQHVEQAFDLDQEIVVELR